MLTRVKKDKAVLVVGGNGYIGSHMVKLLRESGYFPIVLDISPDRPTNSVEGVTFVRGNAGDKGLIKKIHHAYHFTSVIHFAALIQVGESVTDPLKYYKNNVAASINLIEAITNLGVNNIVFSSSAAVYGNPIAESQINEKHPTLPINPYGQTKLIVENILADCCRSNTNMNAVCLRYFNVAGADPEINITERKFPPTNLIPIVLQKADRGEPITIFGDDYKTKDGTCIRDYIHVKDLCAAHLNALKLMETSQLKGYLALNLGTGNGHSVREVIETAELVTQKKLAIHIGSRRPGDPGFLVADGSLAKEKLDWVPHYSNLRTIIEDAWKYEPKVRKAPQGIKMTVTEDGNQPDNSVLKHGFFAASMEAVSSLLFHRPDASSSTRPK